MKSVKRGAVHIIPTWMPSASEFAQLLSEIEQRESLDGLSDYERSRFVVFDLRDDVIKRCPEWLSIKSLEFMPSKQGKDFERFVANFLDEVRCSERVFMYSVYDANWRVLESAFEKLGSLREWVLVLPPGNKLMLDRKLSSRPVPLGEALIDALGQIVVTSLVEADEFEGCCRNVISMPYIFHPDSPAYAERGIAEGAAFSVQLGGTSEDKSHVALYNDYGKELAENGARVFLAVNYGWGYSSTKRSTVYSWRVAHELQDESSAHVLRRSISPRQYVEYLRTLDALIMVADYPSFEEQMYFLVANGSMVFVPKDSFWARQLKLLNVEFSFVEDIEDPGIKVVLDSKRCGLLCPDRLIPEYEDSYTAWKEFLSKSESVR